MIAACVIDASVAIKWVITEEGTEAANRLRWSGTVFHAPDLLVAGRGDILWKKIQRHELTQAEAELAGGVLRLAKIEIHAMGPRLALALQMAVALQHPVYDTTYLALSPGVGRALITADRRLVDKIAAIGEFWFSRRLWCCRNWLRLSARRPAAPSGWDRHRLAVLRRGGHRASSTVPPHRTSHPPAVEPDWVERKQGR